MLWTKKSHSTTQSADRLSPGTVSFACSAASAEKAEHCTVGQAVLSTQPRASLPAFSCFCHQAAALGVVLLTVNCLFHSNRKGRVLVGVAFLPLS